MVEKKAKKSPKISSQSGERIAFYAGSFDPLTWGHIEVIKRSLSVFDRVVVGVGKSSSKIALFSPEERMAFIESACQKLKDKVQVCLVQNLSVDAAINIGACAMVRGLRSETDFAYEMPMALANRKLHPQLETVFFPTDPAYCYISSSIVREIASYGGNISSMVPPEVAKALGKKFKS